MPHRKCDWRARMLRGNWLVRGRGPRGEGDGGSGGGTVCTTSLVQASVNVATSLRACVLGRRALTKNAWSSQEFGYV